MNSSHNNRQVPDLFVDLDGTLIKSDLLYESLFLLLKKKPWILLFLPFWLVSGKAGFKWKIARQVQLDPATLPYNNEFLDFLSTEQAAGRNLILATASNEKLANSVARHLGLFKDVLASNERCNLSSRHKLEAMLATCGENGFDYAGNSSKDLLIWQHARHSILVNPTKKVETAALKFANVSQVYRNNKLVLHSYFIAMRYHQWVKNLLLFVPLMTSHMFIDTTSIFYSTIGFFTFSLCSSGIYLLNDLLDLPADRQHPVKRNRPFAAGQLPLSHGMILIPILITAGLVLSALVSLPYTGVLLVYLSLTLAYSFKLKNFVLIDVITLAGLYTLRVIGGSVVINVELSFWLLVFSMFIFLSLSLAKRCAELGNLDRSAKQSIVGRDYSITDLSYLHSMGTSSGYISVLVLSLFINSPDVSQRYSQPYALWLVCPALLYWISRIWLKVGRNEMDEDPVVFTLRDRISRYVFFLILIFVFLAI